MSLMKPFLAGCLATVLSAPLAADIAFAASSLDKTWPCAQRKRLDLSLGAIWNGPQVREDDNSWKDNPELVGLVKALAKRRLPVDDAKELIDETADKLGSEKAEKLPKLFIGLFQTLNLERRNIVRGIEKYAAKQVDLSERVKKVALELDTLSNKDPLNDEDEKKLDELNEKLQWDTRIYDERNQSLEYVCESPILIEQRLFALAKKIEARLK